MMQRILFVDDEPKLINGLQRMLRVMRHEWEMAFAMSGHEALAILETKPFHVVVADMFMPGMDGCELLERVRKLYPRTVRIVLSGYSDMEMTLKTVGSAHQYLLKPCDAETLKATVARAFSMRDLLDDHGLIQVISDIESLPSPPSIYSEVMKEMTSSGGSLNRVGEIIAEDTGMSAKILQLVNSAFFGLPKPVSNPVRAVNLLGFETVKALVLSAKIFSQFSKSVLPGFSINDLWKHSLATALGARKIATEWKTEQDIIDEAFMAGLLHDVGKLILLDKFPSKCLEIFEMANSANCRIHEAEQIVLGTSHARIGAYLLGIWGISDSIVEAVAYHHDPNDCPRPDLKTLTTVYLANAFEADRSCGNDKGQAPEIDSEYVEKQGISELVEGWLPICL